MAVSIEFGRGIVLGRGNAKSAARIASVFCVGRAGDLQTGVVDPLWRHIADETPKVTWRRRRSHGVGIFVGLEVGRPRVLAVARCDGSTPVETSCKLVGTHD